MVTVSLLAGNHAGGLERVQQILSLVQRCPHSVMILLNYRGSPVGLSRSLLWSLLGDTLRKRLSLELRGLA